MTFSAEPRFVARAAQMMLDSREAVVDYMTPLGLHHQMAWSHHYGPGPWIAELKDHLLAEVQAGRLDVDDVPSAEAIALDWLAQHTD